ncbi:hypothetical protein [Pseudomonas amygdali]|uniref:hypothetical protein n=1 Tax=Pseudomonas amygdali TaxID=47877 RepID=UPI001C58156E|nr:hypothetical protein [Pseudomonas amygdali]QXW42665.1 hypothetical protein KXJ79_12930 [Pseudomonas amygdali]
MSVDNVVRNYKKQSQAQQLLARLEADECMPHTLAPPRDSKEFIIRIQLSHELHYDKVHELFEEAGVTRTITTRDGIQRDLPHAMFYLRSAQKITNKVVFTALALTLEEHAKLHNLRDLNPQIMVMNANEVYLELDASKKP